MFVASVRLKDDMDTLLLEYDSTDKLYALRDTLNEAISVMESKESQESQEGNAVPMDYVSKADTLSDKILVISDVLTKRAALEQTAEEAAELAQACLKMCRVLSGENPTPVDFKTALSQITEESADVKLCHAVLVSQGLSAPSIDVHMEKAVRWLARLKGVATE